MGWKCSLIIIESIDNFKDDAAILNAIGKSNYQFERNCIFDECIYPMDESINIGYYNGNVIISDDYQLTNISLERAQNLNLVAHEKQLITLFPKSEILTVACHSGVNYHGYSLIESGVKTRLKTISSSDYKKEFGRLLNEELEIYKSARQQDGVYSWTYDDDAEDYEEDQLMEDFTFKIAARRLGIALDNYDESEELLERIVFRKYIKSKDTISIEDKEAHAKKITWIKYAIIISVILIWQILKRTVFSK
jgi:hypothetical protein